MKKKRIERIEFKDRTGDMSLDVLSKSGVSWTEDLKEKEYSTDSEHPSVEQMFIRQAIKYLTPKQRAVWEYHNYDRMTQDEIADKLGITQQVVGRSIRAIEKRIVKWCKSNQAAYELLKKEYSNE